MVAITGGQNQISGASKEEYPKWTKNLRVLLNQLRVLDTDGGDKVRAYLGNPILPENYGKSRGRTTQELLDSDAGDGLKAAGFQLGDTLITGSDRREWINFLPLSKHLHRHPERKRQLCTGHSPPF